MPTTIDRSARSAGLLALAALAVSVSLGGCSLIDSLAPDSETRDESGEITEGGTTDVLTLAEGDCLNDETGMSDPDPSSTGDDSVEVSEVPTVPCSEPHDFEVYSNVILDDADEYPGDESITSQADSACYDAFADFAGIGYDESALGLTYYSPTSGSWASGDRTVNCLITDPSGQTTGSLAGAAY